MLGSFMDEMQITPEQFEVACLEGRHTHNSQGVNNGSPGASESGSTGFNFHHGLFQQIWAANDIRIFIRMMTQRNVELQLQALDLIERRQNSEHKDSESFDVPSNVDVHEIHEMKIADERKIHQNQLDDEIVDDISVAKEAIEMNSTIVEPKDKFNVDGLVGGSVEEKFQRLNLFFEKDRYDSADIKSRQEYLRNQRDKILEIKKKARTRQLNETVKKHGRPSSAQIAQKLMQGDMDNETEPPESSILLRKTLAKRLRTEVVNPNDDN